MSKISKLRECPAVGRQITAAECGENRGSRYTCPAECSYFTFAPANYEALLKLEREVDQKGAQWMFQESRLRRDPVALQDRADRIKSGLELEAFMVWNVYLKPDESGLNCVRRWEQAGFYGLKNDERVLLRAKMKTRVVLLEVHRVLDDRRVEVVDLLAPGSAPVVIFDRCLAAVALRFGLYLCWLYPLPYFSRISGAALSFPELGPFEPEEIVVELIRYLGGPDSEPERRGWLAEHFGRFETALHATALARRAEMFAQMDAQFGRALYELKAPFEECRRVLDQIADVEEDDLTDEEKKEGFREGRVWFAEKSFTRAEAMGGRAVLGRALLGQKHWSLQAIGAARLASFRQRFEAQLGRRIQFAGERRDNLATSIALKDSKYDKTLVPPRLLEQVERIVLESSRVPSAAIGGSKQEFDRKMAATHDRGFLEDAIPALNGLTPRKAARDPALRPKLVHLLKSRIRSLDERNLKSGRQEDLNWMLRELGIEELIFDPPPRRKPVDIEAEPDDLEEDGLDRPPPPELPAAPLSLPEANARLRDAMEAFETASGALEELRRSGSFLIEDAHELASEYLDEQDFGYLVIFLIQAWFTLVPPGSQSPSVDFNDFAAAFERVMEALPDSTSKSAQRFMERVFEESRQPVLVQMIALELLETESKLPVEQRPEPHQLLVMIALVRAIVDTLDEALRE